VQTVGKQDARAVTQASRQGIHYYYWAQDSRHVLYEEDVAGDENTHIVSVDLDTGSVRDLTPFKGVRVNNVYSSPRFPDAILLAMNLRDRRVYDLHRLNLRTGTMEVEVENRGNYTNWVLDPEFRVRAAVAGLKSGGARLDVRPTADAPFRPLLTWGLDETWNLHGFTRDGKALYVSDNLDTDTTRLYQIDIGTGEKKPLAHKPEVDVGGVMIHPTMHHVQAVEFNLHRPEWQVLDDSIRKDFASLRALRSSPFGVAGRDTADRLWLVSYSSDRAPAHYYLWDRNHQKAEYLFSGEPALEKYSLAAMKPVTIQARDGLKLHSYLTLPAGKAPRKLPLVLLVHGGPWNRDTWGYRDVPQWLANRGYAVLQVNFRGSTGYGKAFLAAGNREWAGKMHDDLVDGVKWAVAAGIADPEKTCIFGASYGGYAALVGATFTPDLFRCAVDVVGPSNLVTLLKSFPAYWTPALDRWWSRVGNPDTEAKFLESRSPLFKVDQITIPLLIAHGANDARVKQPESDRIVSALRSKDKPVDYLLFPDEGHGLRRPENKRAFYAAAEQFLARHLGGRSEAPSPAEQELLSRIRH
jgi:dipeptidyl aminopeptidase/acylaminoacyl peptidase